MSLADHWERQALDWAGVWTRGPLPNAYADSSSAFFRFLPAPSGGALELGCGEGRVCRDLAPRGYRMTGVDAAPTIDPVYRSGDNSAHIIFQFAS